MTHALAEFEAREAAAKASARQLNEWSKTLIALLIEEQEAKMQASNLPVDPGWPGGPSGATGKSFWQDDPGWPQGPTGGAALG